MPEISRFYGIVIRMYWNEHGPAHFHAAYGNAQALIGIDDLAVLKGDLPARARKLVVEWGSLHQVELRDAWELAGRMEDPGKISPLE